jgi:prepilin-type N-terminal cleavage/methylation domain-containing protein
MNNRKAFTLIELLVVIGIIVVLITILVPIIAHTRTLANITAQKADFQTITTALEAYRQDFGDYPRNTYLPTWNYDVGGSPNYEAPAYFTLATALVGPGPATTQSPDTTSNTTEEGDGADGPGFRTQYTTETTTLSGGISPGLLPVPAPNPLPSWNTDPTILTYAAAEKKLLLTTLVLSPGTAIEERIGISPASILTTTTMQPWITTFQLASPVVYSHPAGGTAYFIMPTGKVWPSYLPAERFRVTFVNYQSTSPNYNIIGQPVLLDHWGNPIEYFTRFGPSNNRVNSNSTFTGQLSPAVTSLPNVTGPLYGYAPPKTAYPLGVTPAYPYGMNAIWDQRDGGPRFRRQPNGQTDTPPWQTPGVNPPTAATVGSVTPYDPGIAFRWMLGDDDNDNLIDNGESLKFDGPFILISAGPSPIDLPDGGFCNMGGLTPEQKAQAFKDSGNIYNFER